MLAWHVCCKIVAFPLLTTIRCGSQAVFWLVIVVFPWEGPSIEVIRKFGCAATSALIVSASHGMSAGGSAPAPLIAALYCQLDSALVATTGCVKSELLCCARHENELQRFLSALHDLPALFELHHDLVRDMGNTRASRLALRTLVACAETFLVRRDATLRLIGHTCSLSHTVKDCDPIRRVYSIWQHDVFADLNECWVIADALLAGFEELCRTLKQCATTSRTTYLASYNRLLCTLRKYNDIDRIRCALGNTCRNALRLKTSHPGYPTVIYNWACARPRIFPHVVFMEPGTSLMTCLSAQFVSTSPLWHELRRCLGTKVGVLSFQENWEHDTSIPLRMSFPERMGVCRILHLYEYIDTTVVPARVFRNFRIGQQMHLEIIPDDSHSWDDYSMLPCDADLAHHWDRM